MKKLFITFLFYCTVSAVVQGAGLYSPAQGPLDFNGTGRQGQNTHGPIMQAIRDNNPNNLNANQVLAQASADIAAFDGRGQNFSSYQQIMTNLSSTTNTAQAIAALQGIEKIIMHLYNYKAYFGSSYDPVRSIFVTGIRQSWCDPRCYGPKGWVSDNNLELKQLIDELENVANVMHRHSTIESMRLKTIVFSYRHWRVTMALSIAAYLMTDAYRYGFDSSIVNQFYQDGLKSTPSICCNVGSDLFAGVKNTGKGLGFAAGFGWRYFVQPIGKFMIGGKRNFSNQGQLKKTENVDIKPVRIKGLNNKPSLKNPVASDLSVIEKAKDKLVDSGIYSVNRAIEYIKNSDDVEVEEVLPSMENLVYRSVKKSIDDKYAQFDSKKSNHVVSSVKNELLSSIVLAQHQDLSLYNVHMNEWAAEQKAYEMDDNDYQKKLQSLMSYITLVENLNADLSVKYDKVSSSFGVKIEKCLVGLQNSLKETSGTDLFKQKLLV